MPGVYETTSNSVRTLFGTDVEDALSIPVQYDNVGLAPPDTGLWIRLAVNHQVTEKRTTGGNQAYELLGEMEATIKAPLSDGDFNDRTVAQTILDTFEGQKVALIEYGSARVSPIRRDGRWYQMVVTIPFKLSFKRRVTLRRHTGVALTNPQVGDSIRTWFGEKITDDESLLTQFDDAPFTQPDADRWVRFTILEGAPVPAGTRGNLMVHRHVGVAVSQVFAPINTGSGLSLLAADRIADAFRAVSVDGITFRTPSVETIGEGREGKWWQTNISVPLSYETVTTI